MYVIFLVYVILWRTGLYTQERMRVKSPGMILSINLSLQTPSGNHGSGDTVGGLRGVRGPLCEWLS